MWDSKKLRKNLSQRLLLNFLWKCVTLARLPINPPTVSFLFTTILISGFAGAWASLLFELFGEGAQDRNMQLTQHAVIVVSYAR